LGLCPRSCKSGRLCGAPVNTQKGRLCFFHSEQVRRGGLAIPKSDRATCEDGVQQPPEQREVQQTFDTTYRIKRQRAAATKVIMPSSVSAGQLGEARSLVAAASPVPVEHSSAARPCCMSDGCLSAIVARLAATPSDHAAAVRELLKTLQSSKFSSASARRAGLASALKKHRGHPSLAAPVLAAVNVIRDNMTFVDSSATVVTSDLKRRRCISEQPTDVQQVMQAGSRLRCELASESVSLLQERLATIEARETLEEERQQVRTVTVSASWCKDCRTYYDSFASVARKHCESAGHSLVLKEAVTKRRWECDTCRASSYVLGQRAPPDCFRCGASSMSWVSFYLPSRQQTSEDPKMQLTAASDAGHSQGVEQETEHGYEGMYGGRQGFAD